MARGESLSLSIDRPGGGLQTSTGKSIGPTSLTRSPAPKANLVYDNSNLGGVQSGPKSLLWLTFDHDIRLTQIETYHWNGGRGPNGGTMSLLEKSTGRVIGPWQAICSNGMGGAPKVLWTALPNALVKKGIYRLEVSSPSTWSFNAESKNVDFVKLWATSP